MLRVGLTGGLGSGKSTVAGYLRGLGAYVIEADELGRALMEPGQAVFAAIVDRFGVAVLAGDGRLNRGRLAELAFQGGRLQELNAIVHPAAIAVVESALIFEVERDAQARGESEGVLADWRRRFDRVIVVTAPDDVKIARYAARVGDGSSDIGVLEAEARRRLSHQLPDAEKAARADYVLVNNGDRDALHAEVMELWRRLRAESNEKRKEGSVK
jgi:dephospho-CoA kinase